jgi:hypothetical protein
LIPPTFCGKSLPGSAANYKFNLCDAQ